MADALEKIIPIIFFITLGYIFGKRNYLDVCSIENLKKFTMDFIVPAIVFTAFLDMEFKKEYFVIVVLTILLNIVLMISGRFFSGIFELERDMMSFFSSGFVFGLLAIPMYGILFGYENISKITVFGIGNEIFIWFIYFNVLDLKLSGKKLSIKSILLLFRSPMISAVILGLLFNYFKLQGYMSLAGLASILDILKDMSIPLVFIIVGYGMILNREYIMLAFKMVAVRILVVSLIAAGLYFLILKEYFGNDRLMLYAFVIYLLVPPPYALTIFMSKYGMKHEVNVVSTALSLNTIFSVGVYILLVFLI